MGKCDLRGGSYEEKVFHRGVTSINFGDEDNSTSERSTSGTCSFIYPQTKFLHLEVHARLLPGFGASYTILRRYDSIQG